MLQPYCHTPSIQHNLITSAYTQNARPSNCIQKLSLFFTRTYTFSVNMLSMVYLAVDGLPGPKTVNCHYGIFSHFIPPFLSSLPLSFLLSLSSPCPFPVTEYPSPDPVRESGGVAKNRTQPTNSFQCILS